MTGQTVNFGGLPLNVNISVPSMSQGSGDCGCTGGGTPSTTDCGCSGSGTVVATGPGCPACKSQAGNGVAPSFNGQNPVQVVAAETVPAFRAVRQDIGGFVAINISNYDPDEMFGINVGSTAAGQVGCVVWGGPVINTINGTDGWNFVAREFVYVNANGVITQTPPVDNTAWAAPVGIALSSNSIYLFATRTQSSGGTPTPSSPVVRVIPWENELNIDSQSADVFDLTLEGATDFYFTNGQDGRLVTLRITSNSYYDELNFQGNINTGDAFLSPYYGDGSKGVYTFMYNAAENGFFCVSSNRYSMAV